MAIHDFVTRSGTGEVLDAPYDVHLDEWNVVQPDLFVVRSERRAFVTEAGFAGVPDLCIEILSHSSRSRDFVKKYVLYASFGVPEYWIVDPDRRSIAVHVLKDGNHVPQDSADGIARSIAFPSLEIDPTGLFERPEQMRD